MLSTYADFTRITGNLTASLDRVSRQPMVMRETEYYLANIENIDSIEALVEDSRLFNYAMKAHGLSDMAYARAFMIKVLEEGRDDSDSFANTLTDTRYREFAETFDFHRYGEAATTFTKARQGVVDRYMRQTLEEDAGADNEGVRLALYFQRKAASIDSAYAILGDKALATVVRTSLGMPEATALLDIDKQKEMLEARIDFADFTDPEKLSRFLERFTNLWELANPQSSALQGAQALISPLSSVGISSDLMLTIQNLK